MTIVFIQHLSLINYCTRRFNQYEHQHKSSTLHYTIQPHASSSSVGTACEHHCTSSATASVPAPALVLVLVPVLVLILASLDLLSDDPCIGLHR